MKNIEKEVKFHKCFDMRKKVKSVHLCSPLHLHSLVLTSSRSMWDCCPLTHPSIRLRASPATHHFDCPTCWQTEPERNRGQGEGEKKEMHVRTEAVRVMHNNISTFDFITTKTDKHICSNYTKGFKQWQRYQRGFWGTNNHSFLLGDSWLRLI